MEYNEKMKRRVKKKLNRKKTLTKPVAFQAGKKLKNKEKRKLSKSLWESTYLDIDPKEARGESNSSMDDDDEASEEESKGSKAD
mmetsp:Transcript_2106/g.3720  ORF Transcript_2106/g.3720 Transcript_2106/m.3720 type:complete len:84 (+) Transcript_2106:175-426(+)